MEQGNKEGAMFTRLLTWTGATNPDGGMDYVRSSVLPMIRQQKGYQGLTASVDRSTGDVTILSVWETEADRAASESALSKARDEGTGIIGGTLRVELCEELVRELAKPPQVGCALMVIPFSMDPKKIDENLTFFKNEVVPQIKAAPGFCALRNMVNRSTGEGYVGTIWENQAAMEAQRDASQARRDTVSQRGITFGSISYREVLLIDNP
jgi:heme-degrading monooxygenase HmoA